MHIFVKTLTGQKCELSINQNNSIKEINDQIFNTMGIPSDEQKLIYNGKLLIEGDAENNGLVDNSNIYLLIELSGGVKGKKKKKMVKKTKKSHKKRKVKLAILKYFKVEGGKVVRLRQPCKLCPAGIIYITFYFSIMILYYNIFILIILL